MKKMLFILIIIHSSLLITKAQWVQVSNGMGNVPVYSLAYNPNNIFAGTWGSPNPQGVYLSTNSGTSWAQTFLNNQNVWSLAVNGNYIFAGSEGYGVYLSTNNGTSWIQTSLNNRFVHSLAVNGNYIFAGSETYGVYLSTNNGTSWIQTSLNNQNVWSLAVNGNYIFAGTDNNNGIYLSTNNGTSWIQTSLNNRFVRSLAVNGNNIFAGTLSNGVYLSTNNGTSWIQTSLNNQTILSLAVSGNNIFAGTVFPNSFYASTDNGANWTQRSEGLGSLPVWALCILNNYVFGGTQNSVYRRPLGELVGILPISNVIPNKFSLSQNYPNPFNPVTSIKFEIPSLIRRGAGVVLLRVYDILGKEVATLVNEQLNPGTYEVNWDASNCSSGLYYCKFTTEVFSATKKMILIK